MRRSLRAARVTTPAQTAATSTGEGVGTGCSLQTAAEAAGTATVRRSSSAPMWQSACITHAGVATGISCGWGQQRSAACKHVCRALALTDAQHRSLAEVWRVLDALLRLCAAPHGVSLKLPSNSLLPFHLTALPAGLASFGSSATAATAGLTARWVPPAAPGSCSCPVLRGTCLHAGQLPPLPCLPKGAWLLRLARAPRKPHVSQPSLYLPLPPFCSAWA